MAWQSSSAISGVSGPGDGNNPTGQPQGTEYTLQGVMRFLQTEWHRHERDRNAWEIERAEMKAKIAKLEGSSRSGKRQEEMLSKHVKMLEKALKLEREKIKAAKTDDKATGNASEIAENDASKDKAKDGFGNLKLNSPKVHNSFSELDQDAVSQFEQDAQRKKSRVYLDRCIQEITYLLTPPAHPPPPSRQVSPPNAQEAQPQHAFSNVLSPQQTLDDIYGQQQLLQRQKGMQQTGLNMSQSATAPNHHPPLSSGADLGAMNQSQQMAPSAARHLSDQQPLQGSQLSVVDQGPLQQSRQPNESLVQDEPAEKVTHGFDAFGRAVTSRPEDINAGGLEAVSETIHTEAEGWDFDETTRFPDPETQTHHRPDTDLFPSANPKSSPKAGPTSHRRKTSMSRRRSEEARELSISSSQAGNHMKADTLSFKVRFGLRGHLDAVRAVIFTGGGSPSEPEICTAGDDGVIKRWIIPARYENHTGAHGSNANDLDVQSYFTHRGHTGSVMCLTACSPSQSFSSGGRALGDGWIFSGGQDATIRVWERGRVDPKATLDGHTDAVWTLCVLPATCASIFGQQSANYGGPDRILLVSGGADGTVKLWAVSAPPQLTSPQAGSGRRGVGGSRRHSVSSGSNFPSSPQPSTATTTPFHYILVHNISRPNSIASPTCITALSPTGETFAVSYSDATILIYDTRTGEEVVGMASLETYNGTPGTGVNSIVATTVGLDSASNFESGRGMTEDESIVHGATGSSGGVEGIVISGHEDRFIRFFDANSGQCTYNMLAHPAAISSLSLSPDGRELVSGGHDASLRFWSLEKRSCTQEITSHRLMRGEGVCSVVWSQDGRWVVSGGGDGVVKVFAR